jgi:hypothetical protein
MFALRREREPPPSTATTVELDYTPTCNDIVVVCKFNSNIPASTFCELMSATSFKLKACNSTHPKNIALCMKVIQYSTTPGGDLQSPPQAEELRQGEARRGVAGTKCRLTPAYQRTHENLDKWCLKATCIKQLVDMFAVAFWLRGEGERL